LLCRALKRWFALIDRAFPSNMEMVRGAAGDKVILLTENQSAYVPLGSIHRLENPGRLPMVLIEVQTGSYFGEDDIIRYEDVYART
jgi:mannose-1-phosphate guanylyltransferase / mannose-6-phosphate isomerase